LVKGQKMTARPRTENQLIEQPAKADGPSSPWSFPAGRGENGLGRGSLLPSDAITAAVGELARHFSGWRGWLVPLNLETN
jgi:hypothetical protein